MTRATARGSLAGATEATDGTATALGQSARQQAAFNQGRSREGR